MTQKEARKNATHRSKRIIDRPRDAKGNFVRVSDYYGENVFHFSTATGIPEVTRDELLEVIASDKKLKREHAEIVAKAVTEWALSKGATHFCHWFQPLTGNTAEKHDAFLTIKDGVPIEKLSASQLIQGEPDASSFPNGGSRSTFEARGYTSWDLSSPMFLMESMNGLTLCIPTAFVSYNGDALDIKTPLLRSISRLNETATRFMNLIGHKDVTKVTASSGAEQEYFLVDKGFYFARPDLVMTGRTLIGSLSSKNQQLDDHYFGTIPDRILGFMQELDHELYKLGIPAKTRHNEVAPGQFELAPIFSDANVANDNNQLIMATIKKVADEHSFVALLHEKPFAGVNGSGKHLNWSMGTNTGINLLEPGKVPEQNKRFLAVTAIVIEAVKRRSKILRLAIASHGNDHRLGANEAPPSIISVFLGSTLERVYQQIKDGKNLSPSTDDTLDVGADQIAILDQDNTDRNRTSPFAFTGNKFEFRAVGSSQSIGLPASILNAAVADVMGEANEFIENELKSDPDVNSALRKLTKKLIDNSWDVVFNGDGYSDEWVIEAERRGLPNLRTTAEALKVFSDKEEMKFLIDLNIFGEGELETRHNVLLERYNMHREIEFNTLLSLVNQSVIPAAIEYKEKVASVIKLQKDIGLESSVEVEIYKKINFALESLFGNITVLENAVNSLPADEEVKSDKIAHEIFPLSELIASNCNNLEQLIPHKMWPIPTYYDMLFLR